MSEILHAGGADIFGPSIIGAAWILDPWHVAPDYAPQVHEKPLPDHGKPPSLLPSEIFDSSITSHVDRLLPDDGVGRNVHIDPAIIHKAVATYLNETDVQLIPHPTQQMADFERRLHHRVEKFEAAAGMSYEGVLASPTLQAELSPKEKGLFHRAKQMDLRLTGAHIENGAHKQEVSLRPKEPTEWDPQALAEFHKNGQLDVSYYSLIHGSAPDGEQAPLLTAHKPSSPSLKVLDDVQRSIRDGMSPLWLAGMPFAAVIGDRNLPPWKRAMMATALLATTLYACNPIVPNTPSAPTPHGTLPPPGSTELGPTLSAAQETGAMMAQTAEGRAFYQALTAHGVDASACSPDVLGSLVVEQHLPLETVIGLTTIATDALKNTPEPDHLKAMVCDAVPGANGTQTVSFYFSGDKDFTGDGTPDIFIPSQAKVLLPGAIIDGVPQVVAPVVEGQPPAGAPVVAPSWSASGGEIPAEIRGLMTVEEQSIRASLAAQGIDPNSVLIHDVTRGSGNDFRMGSGVTNLAQTIAYYPVFDDSTSTKEYAWRPDRRPTDRPWHWEEVLRVGDGKIEVVFDPDSEAPQFVVLTPDESHMMGWFNNLTGQWLTKDGKELTESLASTATMTATIPAPATETPAPTATPETGPTSCLDKGAWDKVITENGFTSAQEAVKAFVEKYGAGGRVIYAARNNSAFRVFYDNALYFGEYKIAVHKDGYTGWAYCSLFALPGGSESNPNLVSVVTDATINGKWSGTRINDFGSGFHQMASEADARVWLRNRIGKPMAVAISTAITSKMFPDSPTFNDFQGSSRSVMKPLAQDSYVTRLGNDRVLYGQITNSSRPDPVAIADSLDPNKELGLFADYLEAGSP